MRTPKRHVATDGSVSYRVRFRKDGRERSETFRGSNAEQDAREFAEYLWMQRGAKLDAAKARAVNSQDLGNSEAEARRRRGVSTEPLLVTIAVRGGSSQVLSHLDEHARHRFDRTILRARKAGWLTLPAAESIAINVLRIHPSEIWGDEWWVAA